MSSGCYACAPLGERAANVPTDRLHAARGKVGLVRRRQARRDACAGAGALQLRDDLVGAARLPRGTCGHHARRLEEQERLARAADHARRCVRELLRGRRHERLRVRERRERCCIPCASRCCYCRRARDRVVHAGRRACHDGRSDQRT